MGGNETGDPGPYRYVEGGGSNVDAVGPDLSLALGTAPGRWSGGVNSKVQVHYFTDPAMRRRTTDILGLYEAGHVESGDRFQDLFYDESSPSLRAVSTSLRGFYDGGRRGWARVFAGYANARRYLHFSDRFGREVPTDQRLIHAGLEGFTGLPGRNAAVRFRSQFSINRLSRHTGAHVDTDWKTRTSRSRIELDVGDTGPRRVVGIGLDHVWADTGGPLKDNTTLVVPVYGRLQWHHRGVRNELGGMVAFTDEDKADKVYASVALEPVPGHRTSGTVSYVERLFAENRDIWFWTERGYGLLDSNQVDYSIDGEIGTGRTISADLEWAWRAGDEARIALALLYRHFDDLYLERHDYAFDEASCSFTGPTEVVTGQAGHVAGGRARVTVPAGPWTEVTARYRYQCAFDGDAAFQDVWAVVPEHLASLRLMARPRLDLTAWLSVAWRSATDWADFAGVDGAACTVAGETVTYHSHLDDVVTVDAKLGKRLWGGRAAFDILGRNLTGTTVRYHPAAADFDLAFFAQLRVELR
ncbi:MAG TPA: hypothetical protein ENO14_04670 [Chromatiales bacterium]|nr:hypothetical protein [Chromatiales bacterium]